MTDIQKYKGEFLQKKREEKADKKDKKVKKDKKSKKEKDLEEQSDQSDIKPKKVESEEKKSKPQHLSNDGAFLGWKKTSLSILKESGKPKNDSQYLKKKKLLKLLWKIYKTSTTYSELSLDQKNRDWKSID